MNGLETLRAIYESGGDLMRGSFDRHPHRLVMCFSSRWCSTTRSDLRHCWIHDTAVLYWGAFDIFINRTKR